MTNAQLQALAEQIRDEVVLKANTKVRIYNMLMGLIGTTGRLVRSCGLWDASTGLFPIVGGTGTAGVVEEGNQFITSVGGTIAGEYYAPKTIIQALADNPLQDLTKWRPI